MFQGVTNVSDLKINQLGQDRDILNKLQQQDEQNLNGNGIRESFVPYLKSQQQQQQQPVNRVLFRDEASNEDEEVEIWKKARSDSADSDDGLTFASDVITNSPLGKPLQPVQESPVAKMNQLVISFKINLIKWLITLTLRDQANKHFLTMLLFSLVGLIICCYSWTVSYELNICTQPWSSLVEGDERFGLSWHFTLNLTLTFNQIFFRTFHHLRPFTKWPRRPPWSWREFRWPKTTLSVHCWPNRRPTVCLARDEVKRPRWRPKVSTKHPLHNLW